MALGDACEIVSGATPKSGVADYWGGDISWVTPADLSSLGGPYIERTPRTLTAAGLASCSSRVLPAGSVLLSSRAPIGHVAINTVPMATNQGFKSLIPRPGVLDAKYLLHWLRYNKGYLKALGNGATFKELSRATVERLELPVPSLDEQWRIAAILDRAEALVRLRQDAKVLRRHMTDSLYLQQFGNPLATENGWPVAQVGEIGRVITGKTPPTAGAGHFGGAVPFVTPGDLESDQPVQRTLTQSGAKLSRTVASGATLVCCIGATIGKVGKAREMSAFNQQINAVEWSQSMDATYAMATLRLMKPAIARMGSSTTIPLLPKSKFAQLRVPVPPLVDQREFASRCDQIEAQQAHLDLHLKASIDLARALQAQAFSGKI